MGMDLCGLHNGFGIKINCVKINNGQNSIGEWALSRKWLGYDIDIDCHPLSSPHSFNSDPI